MHSWSERLLGSSASRVSVSRGSNKPFSNMKTWFRTLDERLHRAIEPMRWVSGSAERSMGMRFFKAPSRRIKSPNSMFAARLPSARAASRCTSSFGVERTATRLGMAAASAIRSIFSAISARFAIAQQASLAIEEEPSRIARTIASRPPLRQMAILFASAKDRHVSAGSTSRWISGSSVRARYSTGSRPPSSVMTLRTSAFCAILTTA